MLAAAKAQEFEVAARLRDEWFEMKNRLQALTGE
jgi:excinuclease UvrABC helicase subunit UvrB